MIGQQVLTEARLTKYPTSSTAAMSMRKARSGQSGHHVLHLLFKPLSSFGGSLLARFRIHG